MAAFMAWWLACLILGHVAFGHRWMIDGTRDIIAVWADLYRCTSQRLTARGGLLLWWLPAADPQPYTGATLHGEGLNEKGQLIRVWWAYAARAEVGLRPCPDSVVRGYVVDDGSGSSVPGPGRCVMAKQQPPLRLELWRRTPSALLDQFFVLPDQALAWEPRTIYGPWADWPDNYEWRLSDRHGRDQGRWSAAASVSDGLVYNPTTRGGA